MPIVSMTVEKAGWPRIGRITSRSAKTPKAAMAAIAPGTASQNGKPAVVVSASPSKAPSIIGSPCAKQTASVALWMSTKPSAINRQMQPWATPPKTS